MKKLLCRLSRTFRAIGFIILGTIVFQMFFVGFDFAALLGGLIFLGMCDFVAMGFDRDAAAHETAHV